MPRSAALRLLDDVEEHVLERRRDRLDAIDRDARAPRAAPRSVAGVDAARCASTACTAVPNRLVFSTSGIVVERAHRRRPARSARTSTIGRPANDLLQLGGRADRGQRARRG